MKQQAVNKSILDELQSLSVVVADTGDLKAIGRFSPREATTNPSLVLKAVSDPDRSQETNELIEEAVVYSRQRASDNKSQKECFVRRVMVNFGKAILNLIPGRVSTEVDARLSFDVLGTIEAAKALIGLYEDVGVDRERILIKIASTWEGILAAGELEQQGIHCNMTLMFSLVQAVAAAGKGVRLVSPFVGRVFDWHANNGGVPALDPGVRLVRSVFDYYKTFDCKTEIMAASFRREEQILELAGCDLLTIAPNFLEGLASKSLDSIGGRLEAKLQVGSAKASGLEPINIDETSFRWRMNEDAMATEKLSEGIRLFARDSRLLEAHLGLHSK